MNESSRKVGIRGRRSGKTRTTESSGGPGQITPTVRKSALLVVKAVVTGALCWWIVEHVQWGAFWSTLVSAKLWVLALVLVMRLVGLTMSSFKWQQILSVHGLRYGLDWLLRWYFVALFLNHFLPTSIGGDTYRIYKTLNNRRGKSWAVLTVFIERVSGLAALALLGWIAALISYYKYGYPVAKAVFLVGLGSLVVGVISLLAISRLRLVQRLSTSHKASLKPVKLLLELGRDFARQPRKAAVVGAISLVFHANKILVVWLLLYALGASATVLQVAVAVVVVDVVGLLPISLGGFGVVEGSFMYVMGQFGVNNETALAAMLLMRTLLIPLSLVGALFYFLGDRAIQAESGSEPVAHRWYAR